MNCFSAAVVTVSDKGSVGLREDRSGPLLCRLLAGAGYAVVHTRLLPDERTVLAEALRDLCDREAADLILTTGGTGLAPRDQTPEATLDVAERLVPGIAEAMRAAGLAKTDRAMLSRGVAALRGKSLIVNLPGSPRAARESLEAVLPALEHGLMTLTGRGGECARPENEGSNR